MFKTGDAILLNEPFNLFNLNTWFNPFVKFFINLWHKYNKKPYVNYSHAGIVALYGKELYLWEAVKDGFIPTKPIKERLKGQEFLILRPLFPFSKLELNAQCEKIRGTKYDYKDVLLSQIWHQVTNEAEWKGKKDAKYLYCTEAVCYIYNQVNESIFTDYYQCDQKDLYFSKHFQHIKTRIV